MQNVERGAGGNLPQGLSLEGAQNELKGMFKLVFFEKMEIHPKICLLIS